MTTEMTPASARLRSRPAPVGAELHRHHDLAACAKVPPERIGEFLDWSDARLRRDARRVGRVLARFSRAVVDSMESPSSVDDFVRSLDLKSISRDHDWRRIFFAIRGERRSDEDYRRRALVKYLQYLSFRKQLLEFIYARRQGLEQTRTLSSLQRPATMMPSALEGEPRTGESASASRVGAYTRLPLGETIVVDLGGQRGHVLVLAGHAFRLHGVRPPILSERHGAAFRLKRGRNVVGRHPESDIALDPSLSEISRAHVVLDWQGGERVSVTDLSSAGTLWRNDETGAPGP